MPIKDLDKRREYARQYYKKRLKTDPVFAATHARHKNKWNTQLKTSIAVLLEEFRKNGCIKCGESVSCCLDAHHLDPSSKDFNIGEAYNKRVKLDVVAAELKKCICVCKNCHAKIHAKLI